MNFSYVEFPCTLSLNTFKANFSTNDVILPRLHDKSLDVSDGQYTRDNDCSRQQQRPNQPESLRHLALDAIIVNWNGNNFIMNTSSIFKSK